MIPKFRAWDELSKKMFQVNFIDFIKKYVFLTVDENWITKKGINKVVLMQSTGLFDKNGVEIYEGDIVEVQKGFLIIIDYRINDGCWRLKPLNNQRGCSYFSNYYDKSSWEITGNIYENPELLEVENDN